MIKALWRFFLRKYRKRNGIWWAVAYTWDEYRWLRIQRDPVRLAEWRRKHN